MKSVRPDYLELYAVTDESPGLAERVRLAIAGGATCVQHRAKCASFEAAKADALAIQSVCREAGVPFIVLRAISDLADGSSPASFDEFEQETADLSAAILRRMIEG